MSKSSNVKSSRSKSRISTGASAASRPSPSAGLEFKDAQLLMLGQDLIDVDAQWNLFVCDEEDEDVDENKDNEFYEKHWELREKIVGIVAHTLAGLQVKGRAASLALRRDPTAESTGPGSFIGLSRSLMRDLLAFPDRVHEPPASIAGRNQA